MVVNQMQNNYSTVMLCVCNICKTYFTKPIERNNRYICPACNGDNWEYHNIETSSLDAPIFDTDKLGDTDAK
jgi:hypothetical protein